MSDQTQASAPNRRQREFDEQIESVTALSEASGALVKAQQALEEVSHVLLNDKATKSMRQKAASDVENIRAYLVLYSNNLNKEAQKMAPMPSMGYGIARIAAAQKMRDSGANANRQPLLDVNNAATAPANSDASEPPQKRAKITKTGQGSPQRSARSTSPKKNPKKSLKKAPPAAAVITTAAAAAAGKTNLLEKPNNGREYDRHEFVLKLVKKFPPRSKNRGQAIAEAMAKRYVPLSNSGIYDAIKVYQKHEDAGGTLADFPNNRWHTGSGRQALLEIEELEEIAMQLQATPGTAVGYDELSALIVKKRREKLAKQGRTVVDESEIVPTRSTLKNYGATISMLTNKKRSNTENSTTTSHGTTSSKTSTPMNDIAAIVASTGAKAALNRVYAKSKTKKPPTEKPPIVIELPKPKNGKEYDRREFIQNVVFPYPKGTQERGHAITEAMEKKYIPLHTKSGVYKVIQMYDEHETAGGSLTDFPNFAWNTGRGRKPILRFLELQDIASELQANAGTAVGYAELETLVMERTKSGAPPSKSTIRNYAAAIAKQSKSYDPAASKASSEDHTELDPAELSCDDE